MLDTETKGTGAQMVPLENVLDESTRAAPVMVRPQPPRSEPSAPRAPWRFKVVDVMTRQVLAQDADARQTVDVLRDVPRAVDVSVFAWEPKAEKWRMLTHRENEMIWRAREQ